MQEVTLSDMLDARERRAYEQQQMLHRYPFPLVSFTMNIAGSVKDSPLIRRAFGEGVRLFEHKMREANLPIVSGKKSMEFTGCEALWSVRGDAGVIKSLCMEIEDSSPMGRLFDMDVIAADGTHQSRQSLERSSRKCLICDLPGHLCASRRTHPVSEIQFAAQRLMEESLWDQDCHALSQSVSQSLEAEVMTTPKPGLVDRRNNGSHRDMTVSTFLSSIGALRGYWMECAAIGRSTRSLAPEESFPPLRRAGMRAEREMLAATGNVNTHKGAIFLFGVLCGAWGRLWKAERPCADASALLNECAVMTRKTLSAELETLRDSASATAGHHIFRQYALAGARGEMMNGLPSVLNISLPALRRALQAGKNINDAAVIALLHLIAHTDDTNMISRGGVETARRARLQTLELLQENPFPDNAAVCRLDDAFIERNLSPGGCADLLAATLFLHALESKNEN